MRAVNMLFVVSLLTIFMLANAANIVRPAKSPRGSQTPDSDDSADSCDTDTLYDQFPAKIARVSSGSGSEDGKVLNVGQEKAVSNESEGAVGPVRDSKEGKKESTGSSKTGKAPIGIHCGEGRGQRPDPLASSSANEDDDKSPLPSKLGRLGMYI